MPDEKRHSARTPIVGIGTPVHNRGAPVVDGERSLSMVETYLDVASSDSGPVPVDLADAVAYYLAIAGALADTAAVAQRGRDTPAPPSGRTHRPR